MSSSIVGIKTVVLCKTTLSKIQQNKKKHTRTQRLPRSEWTVMFPQNRTFFYVLRKKLSEVYKEFMVR